MSTQTPWTVEEEETSSGQLFSVYDSTGSRLTQPYISLEQAALIASAPELLEALEKSKQWVAMYLDLPNHSPAAQSMLNVINKALDKAKGA